MARARIGKLFHLTPLVDSLSDAEYFFNALFSPLCMMRNYSSHWHRHAAIYVIAETSIEPMHVLAPEPDDEATSWYRYMDRYGPRVHNMAFYADDLGELAQRLEAAGVRVTDAGSGNTVFCHPKDTPGMFEFHPSEDLWETLDPRFRPEWSAFADAFWGEHHPLGLQRTSHLTVVVDDLPEAEKFYVDVLDAVPLPDQAATIAGGIARHVLVGEDTIVELLAPGAGDSIAARDLALVGPSVTGITFTVKDVPKAAEWMERLVDLGDMVAEVTEHEIRLNVDRTWGCEYRFTDRVLVGDPRVQA
jgi:catechol 2,3-dioxygenase-like lactoylglutathione lyase family enzyme